MATENPRRTGPALVIWLAVVAVAIAAAGLTFVGSRWSTPERVRTVTGSAPPAANAPGGGTLAGAAAAAEPSVAAVAAASRTEKLSGSGIVLRSDGIILTSNHLVADVATNGGSITATFSTGVSSPAVVVGQAPASDVAVLWAQKAGPLRPATLGSAASLRLGDPVLVIGSALGLQGSVTAGVVSGLHREVVVDNPAPSGEDQRLYGTRPYLPAQMDLKDMVQTDAAINSGNSGGPLVDAGGRVVGMCTAFDTIGGSGNVGVGFAIPIDSAYAITGELLAGAAGRHQ